ncbi:uncharacterized protein JCM15063_000995 [Sporobolomyces koalae]|uniref:uncharacterized protein n=1 Tax=Sporobolomyces koalae TaxID=500713 RepID=UPI00316F6E8D
MSWRAPASKPAPPITSASTSTLDQLFLDPPASSGSTSSSSGSPRSRNLSISSSTGSSSSKKSQHRSAHALLSRKMLEMAGGTREDNDHRATSRTREESRPRAGSTASSVRTTRGIGNDVSSPEPRSDEIEPEPIVDEPKQLSTRDKGKGKAPEIETLSKRARTDSSTRSRTNSNLSTASSISSSSSLSPTKLSTSRFAPLQPSKPVASTSTSSSLSVSPSQGFLSTKRWIGRTPAPTSALASTVSNIQGQNSTSTLETGTPSTSDSMRSSETVDPAASIESFTTARSENQQPLLEDDASTPKAEKSALELPEPPEATLVDPPPNRGWIEFITRGVYRGSNEPEPTKVSEDTVADDQAEMQVETAEPKMESEAIEPMLSGAEDQSSESKSRSQSVSYIQQSADGKSVSIADDTLRNAPPLESYDSSTLTPKTLRPSRSSWWLWGNSAPDEPQSAEKQAGEPVEAKSPDSNAEPAAQDITSPIDAQAETSATGQETIMSTSSSKNVTRSWIQTIWGESPEELAERRKREARAFKMVVDKSNLLITAAPVHKMIEDGHPAPQDSHISTSVTSTSSYLDSSASSFTEPAKHLRNKTSSWAIFSRANPVASSSASTRSRASSHQPDQQSSPPSPQLQPEREGHVKPLTGSIRSGIQRPRSQSLLESDPPVDNLVLPTFDDTFLRIPRSFPPKKSNLNRAVSLVSAYLFSHPPTTSPPPTIAALPGLPSEKKDDPAEKLPKALEVMNEPSRLSSVKRVVCIGVHGWFPNSRLKSVLGEPTGTSVKFATMMHDAVQTYLESSGVSSFNIQAIALEGEGQVEDRVNKLYSQLTNREEWLQALKKADVVFLATHSQGTVVSTQLLARMLDQDLIVGTQTHLLAMCGIAQGPFVYLYQSVALAPYFNYLESAAARELFEFQDAESVVSIKFLESLRVILNAGIKVTVVGSINDQVVPLYSALFSGVTHPAIVRAVYIDSDAFQTSDFLANLVVFSARLRNAGLSDHDLVYHLSEALSGALTGVGHSKIYDEADVFNLAVRHQFETTSLTEAPTNLDVHAHAPPLSMSFQPRDRRNPYLLTWALRGIIEDPHVRHLFGNELKALGEAFETWKPQTKVLKDCKLKLEGIRMINRNTAGKL